MRIRIGLIGCGHRGNIGFLSSLRQIGRTEDVVALCDTNPTRLAFASQHLENAKCACYTNIDQFLEHPGLNTVIVATPDHTHREIVLRAFKKNLDVVCEKPMATTLEDARAMLLSRGGSRFRMAFNFRYHPVLQEVKSLLRQGVIGRILHIEAADVVGQDHGSDYFRRWHAKFEKSGGLLVHKSTHLFDALNWCLEDRPATVFARGDKLFYTPDRQEGEYCRVCTAKATCPFYVDLNQDVPGQHAEIPDFYRHIYLDAECHDGYRRDTCVFHRDNNICDTYNVSVRYTGGALLTYSALFYGSYESRRAAFQGSAGRIEFSCGHGVDIRLFDQEGKMREIEVPRVEGGHGGSDIFLMRSLFDPELSGGEATAEDGYWSLAISDAANQSITSGKEIKIQPNPCIQ